HLRGGGRGDGPLGRHRRARLGAGADVALPRHAGGGGRGEGGPPARGRAPGRPGRGRGAPPPMNDPTADRWQRLDDLLDEALARDPDARTAYLRAACGHDPALYAEALALLASADEAARALGESADAFAAPLLAGDAPF